MATPSFGSNHVCNKTHTATKPTSNVLRRPSVRAHRRPARYRSLHRCFMSFHGGVQTWKIEPILPVPGWHETRCGYRRGRNDPPPCPPHRTEETRDGLAPQHRDRRRRDRGAQRGRAVAHDRSEPRRGRDRALGAPRLPAPLDAGRRRRVRQGDHPPPRGRLHAARRDVDPRLGRGARSGEEAGRPRLRRQRHLRPAGRRAGHAARLAQNRGAGGPPRQGRDRLELQLRDHRRDVARSGALSGRHPGLHVPLDAHQVRRGAAEDHVPRRRPPAPHRRPREVDDHLRLRGRGTLAA